MVSSLQAIRVACLLAFFALVPDAVFAQRREAFLEKLEAYRSSEGYYREPFRQRFHFSPEINWMNDPNGLVFHEGEYHLFYQFNPFGDRWGHMSWGHAVSPDLVFWEHLPIALYEEEGVMVFSGCAVVDARNTSGFGRDDQPALVAIYSGHTDKLQTQNLAYSVDRGRTWTRYEKNPVIDIGLKDFRDPKVFWHEGTKRWVMVVALAAEKRVRFYGSDDLKEWKHLSDFGPAGAPDKPNWECPDLFLLPIEGAEGPEANRWVLEVDMGGGAIAGGSGGEYFVGRFDGSAFFNDSPADEVRWVDYGRDFYAPVSWSNIPPSDGRTIWIGWLNNWETHLLPTSPWRSCQSIPRVLSLRRGADGLRLIQQPIRELERLRRRHWHFENVTVEPGSAVLGEAGVKGAQLEIVAEFEVGKASELGFLLRRSPSEETIVGYQPAGGGTLFVDRTRSGVVDFHERFAGRHKGPLPARDGRVKLHVFVDSSSVEVFGNDGYTVISDRIFPAPASDGIEVYAKEDETLLRSLDVWTLQSIWN